MDGGVIQGNSLVIRPDMVDPDAIANLEALVDGTVVCSCNSLPFYLPWKNVKPGTYQVGLRATLKAGGVIEAPTISITVAERLAP